MSTIDQSFWVDAALEMLGRVFGGATAFPKARASGATTREAGRL
jgi:beta-glucosidase-like glycosyl hydrolase